MNPHLLPCGPPDPDEEDRRGLWHSFLIVTAIVVIVAVVVSLTSCTITAEKITVRPDWSAIQHVTK